EVRIAFPDESVGAEDRGKEITLGFAAFEERVHFKLLECDNDQVIQTDRLTDEREQIDRAEFAYRNVSEVIAGRERVKVPGEIPEFLSFQLHQCFVAIKVHA